MMSIQYYDYDGDIDFGIGAHRHDSERGHKTFWLEQSGSVQR